MSHFSRKPISSLVLKLLSDHHTPLESPSHAEQKYALLFFKYCSLTDKETLFPDQMRKNRNSALNLAFLYQKSVIMQYNHHIRNQHRKLSVATYILLKNNFHQNFTLYPYSFFLDNFSCGPPQDGISMKINF
jgi:hypothetical protein